MLLPCNSYAFTYLYLCFYLAIAMLLPCNSYAFTNSPTLISLGGLLGEIGWELTCIVALLTYIHNFSAIILVKYFFCERSCTLPPHWCYIFQIQCVRRGGTSCNSTHNSTLIPPQAFA